MACKKFILKTLFICLQVLSKFTTKYHSTETTVSIHSEVRGFLGRKKFQRKSNLQYNYKYSCVHVFNKLSNALKILMRVTLIYQVPIFSSKAIG
jgi:hypothetical protein